MITVEEAKQLVKEQVVELKKTSLIPVSTALNRTLANDVYCPIDLPSFDQSNVDGYAVNFESDELSWSVVGEIKAGDNPDFELKAGQAARIFTGAKVPENSNAVIMQEQILKSLQTITLNEGISPKHGEHIRRKGKQIKQGELALSKGTKLHPASLSFLNMMGFDEVEVQSNPTVSIIVTGNEIQDSGTKLEEGKVFEANINALRSNLEQVKTEVKSIVKVNDNLKDLKVALQNSLCNNDLLLLTGGISVGDYDYVYKALCDLGVKPIFYKVAQRPGKPIFFGKLESSYVFALPGNPASTLTCYYEYVLPCIKLMHGQEETELKRIFLKTSSDIVKTSNLALFLKAKINGTHVDLLEGQESFIMKSFSEADAFVYLPKEKTEIKKDELVEVHLLPEN